MYTALTLLLHFVLHEYMQFKSISKADLYILAEKSEQELPIFKPDQRDGNPVSVEFSVDEKVDDIFLELVPAFGDILKASSYKFSMLRSACIKADTPPTETNELPDEFIEKVNATKNLDELLALLVECPYCNWINVRMLEKMAASSRLKEAKRIIANYKEIIFSKKVTDIMREIPNLKIPDDYYTKVKNRWNKDFNDITVRDVAEHWVNLQRIFGVKDLELILQNVIQGSVEFCWLIPVELASHARLSAFKNWCDLEDVSYLSIGDHVIKNDQLEFTEEHISITTGILT